MVFTFHNARPDLCGFVTARTCPLSGLPSRPQREVVPDPARLELAATLTSCGPDAPLPAR